MNLSHPTQKSAVIFVADQVGANMLAPYGQTMIETPNLNQIAAESILLENAISDSPDLLVALRSLWYPTHAAITRAGGQTDFSDHLASQLSVRGVESILLTDDATVAQHEIAAGFDRIIEIETESVTNSATTAGDTWLAKFFAQAVETLRNLEPGCLLWIQCRGLQGPWDAPYEYRQRLADAEDPDPPEFFDPPRTWFDAQVDSPDIQLGYQQACAAQIQLLDEFLGVMFDILKVRDEPSLFSLLSTRGFPLGEHGLVGEPENLHDESIHVPWMVRWPDLRCRAYRIQNLVQPNSIYHLAQELVRRGTGGFDSSLHHARPAGQDCRSRLFCLGKSGIHPNSRVEDDSGSIG